MLLPQFKIRISSLNLELGFEFPLWAWPNFPPLLPFTWPIPAGPAPKPPWLSPCSLEHAHAARTRSRAPGPCCAHARTCVCLLPPAPPLLVFALSSAPSPVTLPAPSPDAPSPARTRARPCRSSGHRVASNDSPLLSFNYKSPRASLCLPSSSFSLPVSFPQKLPSFPFRPPRPRR